MFMMLPPLIPRRHFAKDVDDLHMLLRCRPFHFPYRHFSFRQVLCDRGSRAFRADIFIRMLPPLGHQAR